MPEHNTNEELVRQYKTAKEQGNTELADAILWRIIEQNTPMVHNKHHSRTQSYIQKKMG